MTNYVALFRGINVGGKHILPMADLRNILASLGCDKVQTYIQSGNAVFAASATAGALSGRIEEAIDEQFGFAPQVLLLTVERFREIAAANPFAAAEKTPKLLHVSFLSEAPTDPDLQALTELRLPSEQFALIDSAFYLYAPDGILRSKIAGKVDRCLGVSTSARNWRTVSRLLELALQL
ncbi:MAG: DUF1697 domain-containing protein [Gammaproteobacteria bacterium]|nr:DUF1697 domain-containing protein [Gammaproteobacteria bacterium]MDH3431313.1 DUF1697 domain-containing protein [Gammaproteobacteria bacterium]MDH3432806.1 DUF1697 domain-containing protein [Gammaproteobacteria bacterium]